MDRTLEAALVAQCAPTLAGLKPASLFRYQPDQALSPWETILSCSTLLSQHGLTLRIMKQCPASNAVLLYLYREPWLARILSEEENRTFLTRQGYLPHLPLDDLLLQLSTRLCLEQEFPHEIGLFLGYPLGDVVGFIKHKGRNYTCSGQWKSYGDPREAEKHFAQLKQCAASYKEQYACGAPITQLIVAA